MISENTTLSITVNTDNRDVDINAPNKVFEKKMKNVDGSKLEEMLEKLLVETDVNEVIETSTVPNVKIVKNKWNFIGVSFIKTNYGMTYIMFF